MYDCVLLVAEFFGVTPYGIPAFPNVQRGGVVRPFESSEEEGRVFLGIAAKLEVPQCVWGSAIKRIRLCRHYD